MSAILEIATDVSTPLMVAGFLAGGFFLILRQILRKDLFPALTRQLSADIIKLIIERLFTLALVALVLGFGGFVVTVFVPASESVSEGGRPRNAEATLWERNWRTFSEPRGFLGSSGAFDEGGGSWINREEFLAMLNALDLSLDQDLESKRRQLIAMIHKTEAHPDGEPYYNLRYTGEIRGLEDELERGIRNHAIEAGVEVRTEPL